MILDRLRNLMPGSRGRAVQAAAAASASTAYERGLRHGFHRGRSTLKARYDAAQTDVDNYKHWAMADGLSARAANTPSVRRTLRNRSRYEVANNSYARGIVNTLANQIVGTGPRLQMQTPDAAFNKLVEDLFAEWSLAVRLAEKLRTLCLAKIVDGEGIAVLATNPRLNTPVRLDLKLVEADQMTSYAPQTYFQPNSVDGIDFDSFGNPTRYWFLKQHPGDVGLILGAPWETIEENPRNVIHWFRVERPGQRRGVPEIMPALPLFALLRRYTLAVIGAAETAADFAAVLYTETPAGGEAEVGEPFEALELERNMMTTVPAGWRLGQLQAEQPTTTYREFKQEILNEIARCLSMPFNVAACNSASYNYASGRLDHQTFFKATEIEQDHCEQVACDHVLREWLSEAVLVEGLLPQWAREIGATFPHQWFFDGNDHVDPTKEADAQETRLHNLTTSLAREYAKEGLDYEKELRQIAKERALLQDLGLSMADAGDVQAKRLARAGGDGEQSDDGDEVDNGQGEGKGQQSGQARAPAGAAA